MLRKQINTNRLFSILLLPLCFFSTQSTAFQNDYQTTDSTPPPPEEEEYDARFILNAPYSYCKADGIKMDQCLQVGLSLWNTTFQNINISPNFNKEFYYDSEQRTTWRMSLKEIEENYYLPPYRYITFRVPSEGQLVWLFDNGYAEPGPVGTKHFVRKNGEFSIAIIEGGFSNPGNTEEAKLQRLVTSEIPSLCSDSTCTAFRSPDREYTIKFKNTSCGLNWWWRVEYLERAPNGIAHFPRSAEGKWEGQVVIKANYVDIDVWMSSGIGKWMKRYDIDKTDRGSWSDIECYTIKGNCVTYRLANEC